MLKNNTPLYEDKLQNYFIAIEESAFQFPLHTHSYIEYVHVLEGELEMKIGSQIYLLRKGDVSIAFPNVCHDFHTLSDGAHTKLAISNCMLHLLPMHKNILLGNRPLCPIVHSSDLHEDIFWAEERLYHINPKEDNAIFVGSLFSIILCHLYPFLDLRPNTEDSCVDLLESIISYISRHCFEDLSLDIIAKRFGISRFRLSRIFSNTLKTSFPDYLKTHRINNAEFLLLETDKDITTIGYECGFNNQQSFNRAFKDIEKITPSEFRKKRAGQIYPKNTSPRLPEGIVLDNSPASNTTVAIGG